MIKTVNIQSVIFFFALVNYIWIFVGEELPLTMYEICLYLERVWM